MEHSGNAKGRPSCVSPPRTVTETDIVTFVNLVGLNEPPFIDMEWVKKNTGFGKRFAPNPLMISLAMGLGALAYINPNEEWEAAHKDLGIFGGAVGVEGVRIRNPLFPGDTVYVTIEVADKKQTSKGGLLLDWYYVLRNQRDEIVVEFTERLYYLPKGTEPASKTR